MSQGADRLLESPPPGLLPLTTHAASRWPEPPIVAGLWFVVVSVIGVFTWILGDLLYHGSAVLSLDFLFHPPLQAGRAGGISTVIIGTLLITGVALSSAVPISLGTAILLAEANNAGTPFGRMVRIVDSTGIPLDDFVYKMTGDIREDLQLGRFGSAANTPQAHP